MAFQPEEKIFLNDWMTQPDVIKLIIYPSFEAQLLVLITEFGSSNIDETYSQ